MAIDSRGSTVSRTRMGMAFAAVTLIGLLFVQACDTTTPSSPSSAGELTGQNTNVAATFSGTITVVGAASAPADNASDAVLTAEVLDRNGNPVANLTPVNFSTTLGTVRAPGDDPVTATSAVQVITFGGLAQVLLRSSVAGDAIVSVSVADVVRSVQIEFTAVETQTFISLAIRVGGGDSETISTTAPAEVSVVAMVREAAGGVPGRTVRFKIVGDSTSQSGLGNAKFLGSRKTVTNDSGEAFNVVQIKGEGTVTVVVELFDSATNSVIGESNQVIITATTLVETLAIALQFADGSTFTALTAPGSTGIVATVTDARTGDLLAGRRVRFRITTDTATTSPAQLANNASTFTNTVGEASNGISVSEEGTTVTIAAQLLAADGSVEATSNQVVVSVTADEQTATVSLEFEAGGTFSTVMVPITVGILATVTQEPSGDPLVGRSVRFRIVSDTATATTATLASDSSSATNGAGEATNAVTVSEAGSTVTIVAELLDSSGAVVATSNEITAAGE